MPISVILPVHKIDSNFEDAVSSILNQSYKEFELLLIFNGNHESIDLVNKGYEKIDERIRVIKIEMPGLANALNYGIHASRFDIIARMDSDDISHPDRLKIQHAEILNKNVDVIGSNIRKIDSDGKTIEHVVLPQADSEIRFFLSTKNVIAHPSVMFKKSVVQASGGYKYGEYPEDWALWLELRRNKKVRFANVQEYLIDYRVHEAQATSRKNYKLNISRQCGMLLSNSLIDADFRQFFKAMMDLMRSLRLCFED